MAHFRRVRLMSERPDQDTRMTFSAPTRSDHLTTEYSHLVVEHDDLNGKLVAVPLTEAHQLKDPDEDEVEK
jgi:hypothetical protein